MNKGGITPSFDGDPSFITRIVSFGTRGKSNQVNTSLPLLDLLLDSGDLLSSENKNKTKKLNSVFCILIRRLSVQDTVTLS